MRLLMVGVTAPSHIYPGLAVIRELIARGHEVTHAVGDRLAELVTPTGAEHVGYRSVLARLRRGVVRRSRRGDAAVPRRGAGRAARRCARSTGPTRCCTTSAATPAAIAAHHWGVPAIQLSPTYVAWDGYEDDMAEFTAQLKASESGARFFAGMRPGSTTRHDASTRTRSSAGRTRAWS